MFLSGSKSIYSQQKLNESFEGTEFPPAGWSVINEGSSAGEWKSSVRNSKSGSKCAVSNFSSVRTLNTLITKSFIPVSGDSLTFCFRQTFWNNYKDTLNVLISSADSLFSDSFQLLCQFTDSVSYPVPLGYGRKSISLDNYAGQKVWIGFRHINSDGENLRLDDIIAGQPGYTEVGVMSNLYPSGKLSYCTDNIVVPAALIRNSGTADLTSPVNVTYSVNGPVNYVSTKSETILPGNEKLIYFDTIHNLEPGSYTIKVLASASGDINPLNDTLHSAFSVVNYNFGGGLSINGNYFFVNSGSCSMSASSQPQFCWKDTTGSISLISGNSDLSEGLLSGNIDNGFFRLGQFLPEGKKIKFFNAEYDSVFISTNGVIGFRNNNALLSSDPAQIIYLMSQPVPALSALWMDLDFGNSEVTGSRLSYKTAGNQLIITYDKAPQKSGSNSDFVSFQIVIEFGESMSLNSRLLVQYDENSSGENFISNYYNNTLPSHLVGMKNLYGNNYLLYRSKDSAGVNIDGPIFNSSMAVEFGPDVTALNNKCSELEVSVLLEAIYPSRDTITVILRDSESPYKLLESKKSFPDSTGKINEFFTIPSDIYRYYIQIEHRNSLETWSRINGELFSTYRLSYDFTAGVNMAYGSNMIMKNGRSFIYCGDVNKDGAVDGDDLISVLNAVNSFVSGYINEDVNNNNNVDLDDMVFLFNNTLNFIAKSTP